MENNDKNCYRRQITSIKYSDNSTDWFTYLQKHKLTDGDSLSMWDAHLIVSQSNTYSAEMPKLWPILRECNVKLKMQKRFLFCVLQRYW